MYCRAQQWQRSLGLTLPSSEYTFQESQYDEQIQLDIPRTFSDNAWFAPHRGTLGNILNTFAVQNQAFGYPQGINYLAFPLYYVFYEDDPKTAVQYTMDALQVLVGVVLPVYPLDSRDVKALGFIQATSSWVCMQVVKKDKRLRVLFSEEYTLFLNGIVSNMLPTLYANVFSLSDTLLLWDTLLRSSCILECALGMMSSFIVYHANIFLHLSMDKAMQVFPTLVRQSVPVVAGI